MSRKSQLLLPVILTTALTALILLLNGLPAAPGPDPDVYLTGYYLDAKGSRTACYWKNGRRVDLGKGAEAIRILPRGKDVHIIGKCLREGYHLESPCYWKNTRRHLLSLPPKSVLGEANALFLQGDDIYIGGSYEKDWRKTACYWKNGKRVDIRLPEGAVNPTVYSLIVVGNTVHILGSHTTRKESFHYFYLRNGIRVNLPKPAGASYTAFRDLYLVGRDTYITGNWSDSAGNKTACYWKNGKRVDFIQGAEIRYLYSTGKDLYLLVEGPGTFYWKNGTRFPLAEKELSASSLFAVNGDIYLGCSVSLASDGGLFYWKNMKKVPVEVPPGTKYGQIHSLHVVRHE